MLAFISSCVPSKDNFKTLPQNALSYAGIFFLFLLRILQAIATFLDYLRFPGRDLEERKLQALETKNEIFKEQTQLLQTISNQLEKIGNQLLTTPSTASLHSLYSNTRFNIAGSSGESTSESSSPRNPSSDYLDCQEEMRKNIDTLYEYAKANSPPKKNDISSLQQKLEPLHPLRFLYFAFFYSFDKFKSIGECLFYAEGRSKLMKIETINSCIEGFKKEWTLQEGTLLKQFCEKTGLSEETVQSHIDQAKGQAPIQMERRPTSTFAYVTFFSNINKIPLPEEGAGALLKAILELKGKKKS